MNRKVADGFLVELGFQNRTFLNYEIIAYPLSRPTNPQNEFKINRLVCENCRITEKEIADIVNLSFETDEF